MGEHIYAHELINIHILLLDLNLKMLKYILSVTIIETNSLLALFSYELARLEMSTKYCAGKYEMITLLTDKLLCAGINYHINVY